MKDQLWPFMESLTPKADAERAKRSLVPLLFALDTLPNSRPATGGPKPLALSYIVKFLTNCGFIAGSCGISNVPERIKSAEDMEVSEFLNTARAPSGAKKSKAPSEPDSKLYVLEPLKEVLILRRAPYTSFLLNLNVDKLTPLDCSLVYPPFLRKNFPTSAK